MLGQQCWEGYRAAWKSIRTIFVLGCCVSMRPSAPVLQYRATASLDRLTIRSTVLAGYWSIPPILDTVREDLANYKDSCIIRAEDQECCTYWGRSGINVIYLSCPSLPKLRYTQYIYTSTGSSLVRVRTNVVTGMPVLIPPSACFWLWVPTTWPSSLCTVTNRGPAGLLVIR